MLSTSTQYVDVLARDGYIVVADVIDESQSAQLILAVQRAAQPQSVRERNSRVYAIRNLLTLVPQVGELARSRAIRNLIDPVLGPDTRVVRGLLFDKTPNTNWKVAWHQDLSIAVRRRVNLAGYGPWSVKADVVHVQPPLTVLQRMLTVRVHLDDCGPENGPLKVVPGSHAHGLLEPDEIKHWSARLPVACHVPTGGALIMRPLILHASSSAQQPSHRRVIHLEFAAAPLPRGLEWHES